MTFLRKATFAIILLAVATVMRAAVVEGQPYVYKTVDGHTLRLWVVSPPAHTSRDHSPAIVFYHGGGYTGGGPQNFNRQAMYLSSRGVVSVLVEYRLLEKGSSTPLTGPMEDAKSAWRWVRSHAQELGMDPERIAASGGSAGGQMAAFLGLVQGVDDDPADDLSVPVKPAALILFNPVVDLGPGSCCAERTGDQYKTLSPLYQVHAGAPPTLIQHGEADKLVPPAQVKQFAAEMKQAGVPCELVMYPGAGHAFFNSGEAFYATLQQVDLFLGTLHWVTGPPDMTAIRKLPAVVAAPSD